MPFGMAKLDGVAIDCEQISTIRLFVLTESTNVTDGQTDRQTPHDG